MSIYCIVLYCFVLIHSIYAYKPLCVPRLQGIARIVVGGASLSVALSIAQQPSFAADKQPPIPIERYFKAVQDEFDPKLGKSLQRLRSDLSQQDWKDLIAFTREYDAGFRGTVLKGVWKQLEGDKKVKGIEISNSFTYDLIGVNKAARVKDSTEAAKRIDMVEQDLKDFLQLQEK